MSTIVHASPVFTKKRHPYSKERGMKKQLITAILACIQLVKESEYASVLQNKKMKKDTNVVVDI